MSFPTTAELSSLANDALRACGAPAMGKGPHNVRTPITGASLGTIAGTASVGDVVDRATVAYGTWRNAPLS